MKAILRFNYYATADVNELAELVSLYTNQEHYKLIEDIDIGDRINQASISLAVNDLPKFNFAVSRLSAFLRASECSDSTYAQLYNNCHPDFFYVEFPTDHPDTNELVQRVQVLEQENRLLKDNVATQKIVIKSHSDKIEELDVQLDEVFNVLNNTEYLKTIAYVDAMKKFLEEEHNINIVQKVETVH